MATKRKSAFKSIANCVIFASTLFGTVNQVLATIDAETKRIKKNLALFVVLAVTIGILLSSIWLCLLGLLFLYFVSSLHLAYTTSLLIIIVFNLVLMIIALFSIKHTKLNLSYKNIREHLFNHNH